MSEGHKRCIIDIGSNTVRLVVFGGPLRAPFVLYNEKVQAGLGRTVAETGKISNEAMAIALAGLNRFRLLVNSMDADEVRVVATAAARDAENGAQFLDEVKALGLKVELLSGEAEAEAAGMGVISATPDADGICADLGGGSLELTRVANGKVHERVSLPLGVFAVQQMTEGSLGKLRRHVQQLIAGLPWVWRCNGLPLYLVGGSWRAVARVHMHYADHPLSVLSNYRMGPDQVRPLARTLSGLDRASLRAISGMPSARVDTVEPAASLLAALTDAIAPSDLIICSFGLREGLLYQQLSKEEQRKDPLIEAVTFVTSSSSQFVGQGEAFFEWTSAIFDSDKGREERLRRAVCFMLGTGWARNPDFRALGGEERALFGNWVSIDHADRAIMGMALFVGLGGSGAPPEILSRLAKQSDLQRARAWGLALRLGQKLSGGAPGILSLINLRRKGMILTLDVPPSLTPLVDEAVERRLHRLAECLGLKQANIEERSEV